MFESIKGKRVLITGASGGIGSCMALLLAKHGAIVGVHYNVGEKESSALVNEIEQKGGKAALFKADLIKESGKSVVQSFINHFGGLDILVNNAGAAIGPKDILLKFAGTVFSCSKRIQTYEGSRWRKNNKYKFDFR